MNKLYEIRQKIIEQAMRGELVESDASDRSVLSRLDDMNKKNETLLKEKKSRKGKPLPSIEDHEIPHEIPSTWQWVRLGEVSNYGQSEKLLNSQVEEDVWVLELEDIEKDTSRLLQKVLHNQRPFTSSKNVFYKGDVLYGKLRPYLNKVIVAGEDGVCSSEIQPIRSDVFHPEFLKFALFREKFKQYLKMKMYGSKMPRLGTEDGRMALFPLPPLEEQYRIVRKVEELIAVAERVESEMKLQTDLVQKLRKKMLNVSLRGNLFSDVDGKEDLDEHSDGLFNIPSDWNWSNLSDLSEKIHYGYTASATSNNTGVKMVRITDIQDEKVDWESVPFCEIEEGAVGKYKLEAGDILIARTGGTVGKSFLVNQPGGVSVFASYLIRIQLKKDVHPEYIKKFLESDFYWEQIREKAKGTGQSNVNATVLGGLRIPVPPREEQEKIAKKLDSIWLHTEEILSNL